MSKDEALEVADPPPSRRAAARGLESPLKATSAGAPAPSMKTFTVSIDQKLDRMLDELKESYGKTSRAEVFRLAIALLKIADEGRREGLKITLSDRQDHVVKEIVLPG